MSTSALNEFKKFVAELTFDGDEHALAAKLGQAKALWASVALSLSCVRKVSHDQWLYNHEEKSSEGGRQLLLSLGLVKKVNVERRF